MDTKALWKFIRERFPLPVTIPFVGGMVMGTALLLAGRVPRETPVCLASLFAAFLLLRIADDLSDLEFDRLHKPGRGLGSGAIPEDALRVWLWVLVILVLVLNRGRNGELPVWASLIGYAAFFRIKATLPFCIRTLFVNALFLVFPLYLASAFETAHPVKSFLAGGFFWLSAVAHEYTHSLAEEEEIRRLTYGNFFSRRIQAVLGTAGFFLALFPSVTLGIMLESGIFLLALAPWTAVILFLCARLIKDPSPDNAKPFFIHGFLFFLIPLLFSAPFSIR